AQRRAIPGGRGEECVGTLTQGGARGDGGAVAPAPRLPWATFWRPSRAFRGSGGLLPLHLWKNVQSSNVSLDGRVRTFSAVESNLRGMLRKHKANPRAWLTDGGRWFANISDTGYQQEGQRKFARRANV
ncbi:MAG: hypothetical protein L0387_06050, partial [Acidobacteria bacterium]|nr:hypothetical protein [Acidobacteriota bacterium]